jgi:hypothetical protein
MHKLVNPAAGVAAISDDINAAAAAGKAGGVVTEWQMAAGRLAAVTPLLVVGTDSYIEADMVERLKVWVKEHGLVGVKQLLLLLCSWLRLGIVGALPIAAAAVA